MEMLRLLRLMRQAVAERLYASAVCHTCHRLGSGRRMMLRTTGVERRQTTYGDRRLVSVSAAAARLVPDVGVFRTAGERYIGAGRTDTGKVHCKEPQS